MGFLKYFTIRSKLMFLFLLYMAVFIGFGMFAVSQMQELGSVAANIYEHPMQVSNAAMEARVDVVKVHRDLKDLILSGSNGQVEKQFANVEDMTNQVLENLDIIRNKASLDTVKDLEREIRDILIRWTNIRKNVFDLAMQGKINEAAKLSQEEGAECVRQIEEKLIQIDNYSMNNADNLIKKASDIQQSQKSTLIIAMNVLGVLFFLLFIVVIRNILKQIMYLQNIMGKSANTGELMEADMYGSSEIVNMSKHYNALIRRLKELFWLKDGQNLLSQEISGNISLHELAQKSINYLARTVDAGSGVFYISDSESRVLSLRASYAFTKRDGLSDTYELGQGVVGQVALEKKPILLKNIKKEEASIITGTINEAPLNIYAFPLIYEEEVYGVVELSSFEPFTSLKQEFLKESSKIIATNLYSTLQNEKIKELWKISQAAQMEAQESAEELKRANAALEDQQRLLQQQAEELQQTNAELEEQQQLLQQQSEELQQTNLQLEEQHQQLEEQSNLLAIKNAELEKSREELYRRTEELEKANKYKSQFLANMSHELRTPLNSIILLSRLLNKEDGDIITKNDLEKIDVIHKSGQELLRLINDILDLSKIESGKIELKLTRFDSSELVNELKQLFKGIAKEKHIEFIAEDNLNTQIMGDKGKISQILRNFLSNAIKFTERGSVILKAGFSEDGDIVFSVTDTGIGISHDQIPLIFEEFRQVDGSISRKYGGTGLGLSISKRLAEAMGGKIKVTSELGLGSTFSLYLKRQDFDAYEEAAVTEDVQYKDKESEVKAVSAPYLSSKVFQEYALNLSGKRVLIVDDDPRNIFVLASALEDYGAEILSAENGQVAIDVLKENNVDLVLMDIMMPVMDGFETIKAIRKDEKIKDIPIIALTAKALKGDKEKCIESGANDYISKPVDYDVLIRLVKAWICK